MIRARDPRLHRISVAYEGFIVPEGIPLLQYTSRTEPLFVASVSAGTSSPLPSLRKKGTKRGRKKEKGEDTIVTVSEPSDEFVISGQPIRTEEGSDEMGMQRKPQKSLLELMEGRPGKLIPAKTTSPQASSLPVGSPPPAPRHPSRSTPQPALPSTVEPKRRRGQKDEEATGTSMSRPIREEEDQRAAKQQKTKNLTTRGQEKPDSPHPEPQAWLPAPMHGGEPPRDDASIRDFNGGIGCHVASAIEEALLLPKDMAEIKSMRKNELVLKNKRYLGMVRSYLLSFFTP